MAVTPEREAELITELEEIIGRKQMSKPKVVATDELGIVRDADVKVSTVDRNYKEGDGGVVRVRRSDFVTVNMRAFEEQQRWRREERRRRRELDPARTGIWGPTDEDD
jgi:hypothetical protein